MTDLKIVDYMKTYIYMASKKRGGDGVCTYTPTLVEGILLMYVAQHIATFVFTCL